MEKKTIDKIIPELVDIFVKSGEGKIIQRNGQKYLYLRNEYYVLVGQIYERLEKTKQWSLI